MLPVVPGGHCHFCGQLAPESHEARKRLLLTSLRWSNKKKAETKNMRMGHSAAAGDPGRKGPVTDVTSVTSHGVSPPPPFSLPPTGIATHPLYGARGCQALRAITKRGKLWSVPTFNARTTSNTPMVACHSLLRESYFPRHSPESSGENSVTRLQAPERRGCEPFT